MAVQQSGKLPVKTFANPTGVTNVYADGITFFLQVTGENVTGAQIPAKRSSSVKPEIKVP